MTEILFIYALTAGVLLGMGLLAGPVMQLPVSYVAIVAITWPAIALYMLAMLVSGYIAGIFSALWKLFRGEQP